MPNLRRPTGGALQLDSKFPNEEWISGRRIKQKNAYFNEDTISDTHLYILRIKILI